MLFTRGRPPRLVGVGSIIDMGDDIGTLERIRVGLRHFGVEGSGVAAKVELSPAGKS